MFTRQGATLSGLWNLSQSENQSLRDYMEKFQAVVSKVHIPDSIAVDAPMNTLFFESLFPEDLYQNPTKSFQDAIARSNNFTRMEEDTSAILKKMNVTTKSAAPKSAEARQEPRQHAPSNKPPQRKNFVYVVEENGPSGSKGVMRKKGWNVWDRATDEQPQTTPAPSSSSPSSLDLNQWCSYHKFKAHDTRDCSI